MIYVGKFLYTNNQQRAEETERRHGEFNLMIAAEDKHQAVDKFNQRISAARETSELFEGRCKVYLLSLLELDRFPQEQAILFNYTSVAGDPVMPFISCSAPDGDVEGCRILDWEKNIPEIDGDSAQLYLEFAE
jgi:hypothetical protein